MDISEVTEKLRSELTCPLCLNLFTEAVTLDCGHSFCISCVIHSWTQPPGPWVCPLCKASTSPSLLKRTQLLQDLVSISRKLRPPGPGDEDYQVNCNQHQAIHKLYCEDDHTALCTTCLISSEHEAHRVYPIEESFETFKEQLQEALDCGWDKMDEVEKLLKQERGRRRICKMEAKMLKWVILPEYIKTHPDWTEEEQQNLLEEQRIRNMNRLNTSRARMSCCFHSLRRIIEELENTLEEPFMEMFMGGRRTLKRSQDLLLCNTEPAAIGWTVCGTTGMRELLLAFQSHISLDPGTAHSNLIVSEDLKRVSLVSNGQDPQGRPEHLFSVLGAQSFTSGSHYWEVEVGSEMEWDVGICMGPGNDQGKIEGASRSLKHLNRGDQFELLVSHTLQNPEEAGPLHRLGIFLHYEGGHLSFYNVTQGCLIYDSPPLPFQGPLRPFFSLGLLPEESQTSTLGLLPEESQTSTLAICPLSPQC
ncbi:probable E3 ubiquitin-protein ligase TRIML1 [Gracilinanus agilis]|uniref:probable E3 ubiquitin-protein ligase TRIML1 n=1 Tax=Gracilinanus agilis TaxID=191870 RepID=UPI001CFDB726|nr:probable E3 ubiquitin-protein ligase TRIML1 [Gracilinanus agilis]